MPPNVTVTPADHATSVPLDAPITVSSPAGTLTTVTVTKVGGAAVPGQLSGDRHTWTATDGLDPASQYQVTAVASGPGGAHTTTAAIFTHGRVGGRAAADHVDP